ncbi:hypothetical protein [Butyricimonas virosa]|uniref:hypothetical protein n=1 Tax=Butyricimonas virosa TaxID=544645 RepID=UPI00242E90BC|nr:hypothetical protein [Butyricimonas virosa]
MVSLKEELLVGAGLVQGCADGMAQLAAAGDREEMLQCYWDRIDFCLAKNFPTKECLKEHFGGMLHKRGIYIDERVVIEGGDVVLLGACEAECCLERYVVSRLYVKHDSRVVIRARDHAFVMVDALDDAVVEVHCEGEAKVVVNLYARATAVADGDGYAKVVHKNKETYDL